MGSEGGGFEVNPRTSGCRWSLRPPWVFAADVWAGGGDEASGRLQEAAGTAGGSRAGSKNAYIIAAIGMVLVTLTFSAIFNEALDFSEEFFKCLGRSEWIPIHKLLLLAHRGCGLTLQSKRFYAYTICLAIGGLHGHLDNVCNFSGLRIL